MPEKSTPEALSQRIHARLLARSHGPAWSTISVHLLSHQPLETNLLVPAVAEPLLVWIVSGSARIEERDIGGEWMPVEVSAGDFYLTHSETPYELRWETRGGEPLCVMHLYLGLPIYQRAVAEVFGAEGGEGFRLADISGERDETISGLMGMILGELRGSAGPSEMYVQGIAQALAVHLVRHYGSQDASAPVRRGALPAFKLQRVVRLMEAGLDQAFNLESLAAEAELSAFHFSRVFKQSTGSSPSDYFIQLKMAEARRLLRETDRSIVSIALDLGYSSPSHFAQVFRRQVGVSPRDYRG
ncbi:helix-turn-helix domain-containing protein [Rhizobium sp. CF142]|uniref:helix-turn-helix domain-containing protein n=1 Tax=Rhizobium sp. CF142 TaxID=1144314 RepID=UPI00026EFEF2|nr:helix-turn-helix domain-containing protein [Rhizobium sp. CF142]EJJ28670.1 transcriptional regulator containing an amidase domain and an AraC-type DNA-binding HTH domain [Rhizobium sp. CF142]